MGPPVPAALGALLLLGALGVSLGAAGSGAGWEQGGGFPPTPWTGSGAGGPPLPVPCPVEEFGSPPPLSLAVRCVPAAGDAVLTAPSRGGVGDPPRTPRATWGRGGGAATPGRGGQQPALTPAAPGSPMDRGELGSPWGLWGPPAPSPAPSGSRGHPRSGGAWGPRALSPRELRSSWTGDGGPHHPAPSHLGIGVPRPLGSPPSPKASRGSGCDPVGPHRSHGGHMWECVLLLGYCAPPGSPHPPLPPWLNLKGDRQHRAACKNSVPEIPPGLGGPPVMGGLPRGVPWVPPGGSGFRLGLLR